MCVTGGWGSHALHGQGITFLGRSGKEDCGKVRWNRYPRELKYKQAKANFLRAFCQLSPIARGCARCTD